MNLPKDLSLKIYKDFLNDLDDFKTNSSRIINHYRDLLFDFICEKMNKDEYERCRKIFPDEWKMDYYHFINHNRNKLNECSEKNIIRLMHIMTMIKENMWNMDLESCVPFQTSGFCFTNNCLVLFNYR